jgi:uncharacterized membrane protein YtjA (UPF0391 family)
MGEKMKLLLKLCFYALIAVVLGFGGIYASSDWKFWVIYLSIICIDGISNSK